MSRSDTCQLESAQQSKAHVLSWEKRQPQQKTVLVWHTNLSSITVTTIFSSKAFNDLMESIIHFHR